MTATEQSKHRSNQVHIVLQGKGGVGKSLISAILGQYFQHLKITPHCFDTDPVNATFAQYQALAAEHIYEHAKAGGAGKALADWVVDGDPGCDLSVVDTTDYLYGLKQGAEHVIEMSKGVSLYIGLEAIGEADEKGMRTVMTIMNGQLRPVFVRDRKVDVQSKAAEKADPTRPGHVAAPFSGVVTLQVEEGATVIVGQPVASIEAMKMEAAITAPVAGIVRRVAIPKTQQVHGGFLSHCTCLTEAAPVIGVHGRAGRISGECA